MGAARNPWGELIGRAAGAKAQASPVLSEARRTWDRWRDPRARALRARKRSMRSTTAWSGATLLSGGGAALDLASATPGMTGYALAALGLLTGAAAVSSGTNTRRLYKTPLPEAAPVRHPLPPQGSRAREPMRRLDVAEQTLRELLAELRTPRGAVPAVAPPSVDSAGKAAGEAAEHLRGLAGRLQAVERSRQVAARDERPALDEPIASLRAKLEGGVDEYAKLVAAAGRAVAASAERPESTAVTEATEELSGLAYGLRELSADRED